MKKFYLAITATLLISIFSTQNSWAQLKRFSIGPYVEAGFPTGDFNTFNKTGIGAGLNADIKLIMGLGVTGSVGFMYFGDKVLFTDAQGNQTRGTAVTAIPVRVGIKYTLISILYVKLESGAANFINDRSGSAFILAPGVGIRLLGLDVEAKYEAWMKDGNRGFFGLKAGFNF
jgi:hypothetical protein